VRLSCFVNCAICPPHFNLYSKWNCMHDVWYIVRFQVLKAASMKMALFWVVAPCSLVEVYWRFRGATTQKTAIVWYTTRPFMKISEMHFEIGYLHIHSYNFQFIIHNYSTIWRYVPSIVGNASLISNWNISHQLNLSFHTLCSDISIMISPSKFVNFSILFRNMGIYNCSVLCRLTSNII
jgi:hypothetical protein